MSISDKLKTILENIPKIYESGAKTEWSTFWDSVQQNGERTNYTALFFGGVWDDITFKPKYDINILQGNNTFATSRITNLKQILIDCGVKLSLGKADNVGNMFTNSLITHLPEIDITSAYVYSGIFASMSKLVSVDKIVFNEKAFSQSDFGGTVLLEHIIFDGTIANYINLQWSPKLDNESAKSVINCLKNYQDEGGASVYSIYLHPDVWTNLNAEGNVSPNGNTWQEYVVDLGWTY